MHPGYPFPHREKDRFPRRRGDAPWSRSGCYQEDQFPPQARGCTWWVCRGGGSIRVSPAGAGMHPGGQARGGSIRRFPRRRGDAPPHIVGGDIPLVFPPQARGCTPRIRLVGENDTVSPAGAGMHPEAPNRNGGRRSFPRRRGDAPNTGEDGSPMWMFPPQARGCTRAVGALAEGEEVSPAGAGMHRRPSGPRLCWRRFPRRRGDAPPTSVIGTSGGRFPPQARGCTEDPLAGQVRSFVSPAGAGMHLRRAPPPADGVGFPRRRGDAPSSIRRTA